MSIIARCQDCHSILKIDEKSGHVKECECCGSNNIGYEMSFSDDVNIGVRLHDQVSGKLKVRGFKKPRKEFTYGDELYVTKNKWISKQRIIDRENDRYVEKIVDKETGETIHECDEPLSTHFGHGSAKFKKN